jgi:hypothetical protein
MSTDGWTPPGSDGRVAGLPRPLPVPPPPGLGAWQPPSSPPRPRRRWVLVVVLALVACAAVGVVAVTSSDGDDDAARPIAVDPADLPPLVRFADPDGEFEIAVPESWLAISTRGDLTGMGDEEFPDDAARGGSLDMFLSGLPRLITFTALDPDELTTPFVTNINVLSVPRHEMVDDLDDLETAAPAEIEMTTPAEQRGDPERVELAAGDGLRVEYELAAGVVFVQYYVIDGSTVWTVTMNSDDFEEHEALFDAMAATFSLDG